MMGLALIDEDDSAKPDREKQPYRQAENVSHGSVDVKHLKVMIDHMGNCHSGSTNRVAPASDQWGKLHIAEIQLQCFSLRVHIQTNLAQVCM